ncbi:MAG: hypothetical protein JNM62_04280 [Flavobacteriales bacterium]|nr:hypothetical protein [Flavobacteriales bacterium]
MHTVLLPTLLQFLMPSSPAANEGIPLERAVKDALIGITAESTGGHTGECLSLTLTNQSDRPLRTSIPAGWLMQNSDHEAQDLMIVDHQPVELPARSSKSVACKAYCVESSDSSPEEGIGLRSVGLARPTWVKLAEHLVKNPVSESNTQAAVWAVANDHDIAGIDPEAVTLRKFVADLTGRKVPWYAKNYAPPTEERRVFSDAPTSVHGEIDFYLNTNGVVTVLVHNAQGRLMHTIGKDRHLGPGQYGMEVDLTVLGWAKGTYTIQFFVDGSRSLKKLEFEV